MKNSIYRSNVYLGADYSDSIQHFKYIKREQKNGKWVYYYNTSDLNKQSNILRKNIKSEKNMIKNKTTYTNPQTGQKFGPEHYKKAVKSDYKDLIKTNAKIQGVKYVTKGLNTVSKVLYNMKKLKKVSDKSIRNGQNKIKKLFKIH